MPDRREYMREWLRRNADRVKDYRRATQDRRNARSREKYRQSAECRAKAVQQARDYSRRFPLAKRAALYGVERDDLERMLDRGCAICGAGAEWAGPSAVVRLHVDHDHRTGRVRGVLCDGCNLGIGKFYDDPMLLAAAADYVLEHAVVKS